MSIARTLVERAYDFAYEQAGRRPSRLLIGEQHWRELSHAAVACISNPDAPLTYMGMDVMVLVGFDFPICGWYEDQWIPNS